MKNTLIIFITLVFGSSVSYAQIADKTEEKAKEKTNERIDSKIDKGIDSGLDAIEGLFNRKGKPKNEATEPELDEGANAGKGAGETSGSDQDAANAIMAKMFGSGDVELKDEYSFDHNFIMSVESFDKKGKANDPLDIKMYTSEESGVTGMEMLLEGQDMFIIYDLEKYQTISFMNTGAQKMAMVMKIDESTIDEAIANADSDIPDNSKYKFIKTGKTKTISGYNCEEYKMENPDADQDWNYFFWIAPDGDFDYMRAMSSMFASNKQISGQYKMPENYPSGAMMQTVGESKKNDEKVITTVKDIHMNDKYSRSTSGYQVMNLSGMGGGK